MKYILLFTILITSHKSYTQQNDIDYIRGLFIFAAIDNDSCEKLQFITKDYKLTNNPVNYSYYIASQLFMSKHKLNPYKKIKLFNYAKNELNKIINVHPNILEIRFLRFIFQKKSPTILNFNSHIDVDYEFIVNNIQFQNDNLKEFILPILNKLN